MITTDSGVSHWDSADFRSAEIRLGCDEETWTGGNEARYHLMLTCRWQAAYPG
jgi:hypothetical protein